MEALGSLVVPDAIEPVVGVRSWLYKDGFLHSVHLFDRWYPRVKHIAKCYATVHRIPEHDQWGQAGMGYWTGREPHTAPHENCRCGIHCLTKRLDELKNYVAASRFSWVPVVYGTMYGWGQTYQGEYGFKTEFAYPKELLLLPGPSGYFKPKSMDRTGRWLNQREYKSSGHPLFPQDVAETLKQKYGVPVHVGSCDFRLRMVAMEEIRKCFEIGKGDAN